MTKSERANPELLQASRKKRIAAGSGTRCSDINKLLKMHRQMADMMKKMGKGGMLKQAMKGMFGKGGGMPDPSKMDPPRWRPPPRRWARSCPAGWAALAARAWRCRRA